MPKSKRPQFATDLVSTLTDTTEQFQQLLDLAKRQPAVPYSIDCTATILEKLEVAWTGFIDCNGRLGQWPITASISATQISREYESSYFDACRLCLYLSDGSRGFANRRQQLVQVESEILALLQSHAERFANLACQLTSATASDWKPIVPESHDPTAKQSLFHRVLQQDVESHHYSVDEVVIGKQVISITGLSAKIILGDTPSICPSASPKVQEEVTEQLQRAIQARFDVPNDRAIHWIGHQAGATGKCQCHPESPYAEQWRAMAITQEHCDALRRNFPMHPFNPTIPHFPRPRGYLGESLWNRTSDAWPTAKAHLEKFIECVNRASARLIAGRLPDDLANWWVREWAEEFLQHTVSHKHELEDIEAMYEFSRTVDRKLWISRTSPESNCADDLQFTYYDRSPYGGNSALQQWSQEYEHNPPTLSRPIPEGIVFEHGPFPGETKEHHALGWRLTCEGFLQYLDVFAENRELRHDEHQFFSRVCYDIRHHSEFASLHSYVRDQPLERIQEAIRQYCDESPYVGIVTLPQSQLLRDVLDHVQRWLAGCLQAEQQRPARSRTNRINKPKEIKAGTKLSQAEKKEIRRIVENYKESGLKVREFIRNFSSYLFYDKSDDEKFAVFERCRKNYENHFGKKPRQVE